MNEKVLKINEFMGKKKILPYVRINSTSEYFKLPRKEREKWGLYLLPYALPWDMEDEDGDGWAIFEKEIKKQYPIQYFFRDTLYTFFGRRTYRIKHDVIYPIQAWFNNPNKNIRACVPRHRWIDRCELVWTLNRAIILDFKNEIENGIVDWNHSETVREVRDWVLGANETILKKLPELEQEVDCVHKIWKGANAEACYNKVRNIEGEIEKIKTELICQLAKYREYLWT